MLSHALIAHIKPCALNFLYAESSILYPPPVKTDVIESAAKLVAVLTWGLPSVCCLVRA